MANCIFTNGYTIPTCLEFSGGINYVAIAAYNGTNTTYVYGTDDIIGTMSFTGATNSYFKFEQVEQTSALSIKTIPNKETGTIYTEQTLELMFHGLDAPLLNRLKFLLSGRFSIFVYDNAGKAFHFGMKAPARSLESNLGTGKGLGDTRGGTVTIQCQEPGAQPLYEVYLPQAIALTTT